jgi:hypothetical protein
MSMNDSGSYPMNYAVPPITNLPRPRIEKALEEIRELKAQVKALQDRIEQLEFDNMGEDL